MALARFIAALFSRCGRWNSRSTEPELEAHVLGRRGEEWAARHLRRHGYKVLYRNFRAPHGGEVDLVCRDKALGELVFVEVKTRSRTDFGQPGEAVDRDKQRLIARGALAWLRLLHRDDVNYRFDVVEVLVEPEAGPRISIIRDAFQLPAPWRW